MAKRTMASAWPWAVAACLAASGAPTPAADVYYAARIWTGAGVVENAVLVVEAGKVAAVGKRGEVEIPADAAVHDLGIAEIIPGLVVAETDLAESGRDDVRTLTPEVRAADGVDFFGDYSKLLAAGVTSIQVSPGARRLVGGQGAVVKLAGDSESRMLRDRESLRVVLTSASRNPPTLYDPPVGAVSEDRPLEPTKKQPGATLAGATASLRGLFRAARTPGEDPVLLAVTEFLKPTGTVRIAAHTAAEVRAAARLAQEHQFNLLLVAPRDLSPFAAGFEQWKGRGLGVLLNLEGKLGAIADRPTPRSGEPSPKEPWEIAAELTKAGVAVAVVPSSSQNLDDLLVEAAMFARGGWTPEQTLRAVTLTPAELLGVAKRVGSLEAGKDADFVVLDETPFSLAARVAKTFVDGKAVYDRKTAAPALVVKADRLDNGPRSPTGKATVVIEGGKVRSVAVGEGSATTPDAAEVVGFPAGSVIVPGFFDLGARLGLDGAPSGVSMSTKLGARLTGSDRAVAAARQGGVTAALLVPDGAGPKPVAAFKLGDDVRVVRDPAAIAFEVGNTLDGEGDRLRSALRQGKSYHESWLKYEAEFAVYEKKKREYDEAKAKADAAKKPEEKKSEAKSPTPPVSEKPAGKETPKAADEQEQPPAEKKGPPEAEKKSPATPEKKADEKKADEKKEQPSNLPPEPKPPTKPTTVETLEPYRLLFANKIPAMVAARRLNAMELVVKVFRDEFDVRTVLAGGDDYFRKPSAFAGKGLAFVAGPTLVQTVDDASLNVPQSFALGGLSFGFQSRATTGARDLPDAVLFAVRKGLGSGEASAALARTPASILGLDGLGAVEAGKDADLVVLSGPLFAPATRVLAVMIDGKWVHRVEAAR